MKILILVLLIFSCCGFSQVNQPYIGYVYPAGGQAGTTFSVIIGGQNLKGANSVYFSTGGISAKVIDYQGPSGPLNPLQLEELRRKLQEIRDKRAGKKISEDTRTETEKLVKLPDIPELRDLESKTPKQLSLIYEKYLNRENKPKPPMAEELQLQITIGTDVAPGDYELWLKTPAGLTNPVIFQIGKYPEFCCTYNQRRYENENIDRETEILQIPCVLNGRIMPGKVNRFTLRLEKGKEIFIIGQARKLVPYLADGVPGWFQSVIALYDEKWKEVAYADDYYFQPDPVIEFKVPETGIYFLEIRDSIYRGREDFVYRIYVMEKQEAGTLFPHLINPVYGLDEKLSQLPENVKNLPKFKETEQNLPFAQSISIPVLIKGCIDFQRDIDTYRFFGRQGDTIVVEVFGRRIGSPIDSLIKLKNQMGQIIQWNDDAKQDVENGLLTHYADSYLMAKLPYTGNYTLDIIDAQGQGGDSYYYFLRVSKPLHDFNLIVSPSRINAPADGNAVIKVFAVKKDGWDQDIELSIKNCPDGVVLDGARIPAGRDSVRMTLKVPYSYAGQNLTLEIEGISKIDGKEAIRTAKAAEEKMQAFAYFHLVPSKDLVVSVNRARFRQLKTSIQQQGGVKIPAGGSAIITCEAEKWFKPGSSMSLSFELNNPPDGIKIADVSFEAGKYILTLSADKKLSGYRDNLIIEVFEEVAQKQGRKKTPAGFLPAIPVEVVKNE
ncbi:MAG: hypothetical protein NC831_03295 [Candidatus Omnitrophica bacterium]|nr:hypothetical protein [Candidatus Omnitrophota bacterium]